MVLLGLGLAATNGLGALEAFRVAMPDVPVIVLFASHASTRRGPLSYYCSLTGTYALWCQDEGTVY